MHSIITFFSRMFLTIYSKISFYVQEILSVLHIKIITNHSSYVYSFFNCFHIKIPILQFYMPQLLPFHNFFNFKSGGACPDPPRYALHHWCVAFVARYLVAFLGKRTPLLGDLRTGLS